MHAPIVCEKRGNTLRHMCTCTHLLYLSTEASQLALLPLNPRSSSNVPPAREADIHPQGAIPMTIPLTASGEIATFQDVDQQGKSR